MGGLVDFRTWLSRLFWRLGDAESQGGWFVGFPWVGAFEDKGTYEPASRCDVAWGT